MSEMDAKERLCQWPGCCEPVARGVKRDKVHCDFHASERKRLMAKLRQRLKRDKDRKKADIDLRRQLTRANAVKIPEAIRMAIRLLRGGHID
jgi:hypothetical protein